jgi:hypothetical protein
MKERRFSLLIYPRVTLAAIVVLIALAAHSACSQNNETSSTYALAFEHINDQSLIYVATPGEFEPRAMVEIPQGEWLWVSPDGESLAILSRGISEPAGILKIVRLSTGEEIASLKNVGQFRFERIPYFENVAWAPNGTMLAFLTHSQGEHGTDIAIYDLETEEVSHVTGDEALKRGLAWSSDGRQLAFAALQPCGESAWDCPPEESFWTIQVYGLEDSTLHTLIDLQDTGLQRANNLGMLQRFICDLSWSPDDAYLLFEDGCDPLWPAYYKEVFVVSVPDEQIWQLTDLRDEQIGISELGYASWWQSDSMRLLLAYSKAPWGPPTPQQAIQVGVLEISTTEFMEVNELSGPDSLSAGTANWSPNGEYLAWFQTDPERRTIIAKLENNQLTPLNLSSTLPSGTCDSPQWSPDSRYLAYTISEETSSSDICLSTGERTIVVVSVLDSLIMNTTESLGGDNRLIGWIPFE